MHTKNYKRTHTCMCTHQHIPAKMCAYTHTHTHTKHVTSENMNKFIAHVKEAQLQRNVTFTATVIKSRSNCCPPSARVVIVTETLVKTLKLLSKPQQLWFNATANIVKAIGTVVQDTATGVKAATLVVLAIATMSCHSQNNCCLGYNDHALSWLQ